MTPKRQGREATSLFGHRGAAAIGPSESPEPLLISAQAAAKLLSISERTLRDRTKDGSIPALRLGGRVLYSYSALADWIDRCITNHINEG